MVPILSSPKKLSAGWIYTLAFFGFGLVPLADSQAIDITQEGQELVIAEAVKMTFIVPKGGLKEASLRGSEFSWTY